MLRCGQYRLYCQGGGSFGGHCETVVTRFDLDLWQKVDDVLLQSGEEALLGEVG